MAAKKVPHALNILDRFPIMKKFNEAVDQVRRSEMSEMKQHHGSDAVLKNSRWCLLKRRENLKRQTGN
ncbi:MAG: transposase [Candidatus Thiodiazotropha sp.]